MTHISQAKNGAILGHEAGLKILRRVPPPPLHSQNLDIEEQIGIRRHVEPTAVRASHRLRAVPLFARHVQPASLPLPHFEHALGPALDKIHAGLEDERQIPIGAVRLARRPARWGLGAIRVLDVERHVGSVTAGTSNGRAAAGRLDVNGHVFCMGECDDVD